MTDFLSVALQKFNPAYLSLPLNPNGFIVVFSLASFHFLRFLLKTQEKLFIKNIGFSVRSSFPLTAIKTTHQQKKVVKSFSLYRQSNTVVFSHSRLLRIGHQHSKMINSCICPLSSCAAGFQDGPYHRHEGARLLPAEPWGLLRPGRPLEAGVGEGGPGPRQPAVHPPARRQVGMTRGSDIRPRNVAGVTLPHGFHQWRRGSLILRFCKRRRWLVSNVILQAPSQILWCPTRTKLEKSSLTTPLFASVIQI